MLFTWSLVKVVSIWGISMGFRISFIGIMLTANYDFGYTKYSPTKTTVMDFETD